MTALWLPAAAVFLIALAIWSAGFWVVGSFSSKHGARSGPGPTEVWIWGLATWTLGLFLLASLGGFRAPVLVALVIVLAATGGISVARRVRGAAWRATAGRTTAGRATAGRWALGASLCLPLGFLFAVTVNPTMSWDAAVYHLTLPDLYLREGGFREIPFLVYGMWPHAVELLFGVALAIESYVAAKALHFGFGLLVAVTLFRNADAARHGRPAGTTTPTAATFEGIAVGGTAVGGIAAGALFLLNDVVLFEMRAAYVDLAMAFFALAAFLLIDHWLDQDERDDRSDRLLVSAGLACGLLAASKINGVVTAACLAALALARLAHRLRTDRRSALRGALALALPVAALWTPWVLRTWATTGNPFYPLFWDVFGGPDWSARLGEQFLAWQRTIGMGREPLDHLLLPWRVFTAGGTGYEHFDGRLTPLWLLFLPLALWRAASSSRTRRALAVAALLFIGWAAGSQQMRFLIPTLPLLALAVGDGVVGLLSALALRHRSRSSGRDGGRAGGRAGAVCVAVTGLATLAWLAAFTVTQTRLVESGWSHMKLYSDPRFERPAEAPRPPVFDAVANLAGHPTVLLLNSNHVYHCRPNVCWANSFFEAPQIDEWLGTAESADEAARRLRERGVSYVAWAGTPRFRHAQPILDLLARPDLARPVFSEGADRLWQLTDRRPADRRPADRQPAEPER